MTSVVTRPVDLWRLAELAERRGIRILVEPISGEHFATSGSKDNILYRLTGFSCTCKGFLHWQRCSHHSLLLSQLGWLPDPDPDPASPTPAAAAALEPDACPDCDGSGQVVAYHGPEDEPGEIDCGRCGGSGEVEPGVRSRASDEPDPWDESPYDSGHRPAAKKKTRGRFGLTDEELVVLRGEAARLHAERGWPLVDWDTGAVLDSGGRRAA